MDSWGPGSDILWHPVAGFCDGVWTLLLVYKIRSSDEHILLVCKIGQILRWTQGSVVLGLVFYGFVSLQDQILRWPQGSVVLGLVFHVFHRSLVILCGFHGFLGDLVPLCWFSIDFIDFRWFYVGLCGFYGSLGPELGHPVAACGGLWQHSATESGPFC